MSQMPSALSMPRQQSDMLMDIAVLLPDLPLPLHTLPKKSVGRLPTTDALFQQAKNDMIDSLQLSRWQQPAILLRVLEDYLQQTPLLHGHPLVRVETCATVLKAFTTTIAEPSPWHGLVTHLEQDEADALECMSASTFFWTLYMDRYATETLPEESRLVIGNAYLFAQWKEEVENETFLRVLSKNGITTPSSLQSSIDGFLNPTRARLQEAQNYFELFTQGRLSIQRTNFKQYIARGEVQALLQTSPWCGIFAVLDVFKQSMVHSAAEGAYQAPIRLHSVSVRGLLTRLLDGENTDAQCEMLQQHHAKRMHESRFKLAILIECVVPQLPQETQSALGTTVAMARQLMTRDKALSFTGTITKGMEAFARAVLQHRPEMERVLMAEVPFVSQLTAGFIQQTLRLLWQKASSSPSLQALVLIGVATRGGLFLSHQAYLTEALASVLRLLVREL